jgi:hypothetical protein
VIGICTFIALLAGYFHVRKVIVLESISRRLDTVAIFPIRSDAL